MAARSVASRQDAKEEVAFNNNLQAKQKKKKINVHMKFAKERFDTRGKCSVRPSNLGRKNLRTCNATYGVEKTSYQRKNRKG